ncbi:MAG: FAD:protein FMN transferase [Clostridia bacterium]|nr:FAD:protein FMN transferase [Clostridia bacterium]
MKRIFLIGLVLFLLGLNAAAGAAPNRETAIGFQLDTVITLTAYCDRQVLEDALAESGRYERLLSRTIEGSDVWRINHAEGKPVEVDSVTAEVIRTSLEISGISEGAFDITIAPASVLWDFKADPPRLPSAKELDAAAQKINWRLIELDGNTVCLPAGMMIDLGAIAKGYIADAVSAYLRGRGVESAILSFGGNIICIGTKPDGSPWKVGIQDIDRPSGEAMLALECTGGSVVTSGIYERGFDFEGVRYHHLLDPATGWPAWNDLASVTVLTDSSMYADALATAAFVLGEEKGMRLIESLKDTEAILIRRDRTVLCSSGAGAYHVQTR